MKVKRHARQMVEWDAHWRAVRDAPTLAEQWRVRLEYLRENGAVSNSRRQLIGMIEQTIKQLEQRDGT